MSSMLENSVFLLSVILDTENGGQSQNKQRNTDGPEGGRCRFSYSSSNSPEMILHSLLLLAFYFWFCFCVTFHGISKKKITTA